MAVHEGYFDGLVDNEGNLTAYGQYMVSKNWARRTGDGAILINGGVAEAGSANNPDGTAKNPDGSAANPGAGGGTPPPANGQPPLYQQSSPWTAGGMLIGDDGHIWLEMRHWDKDKQDYTYTQVDLGNPNDPGYSWDNVAFQTALPVTQLKEAYNEARLRWEQTQAGQRAMSQWRYDSIDPFTGKVTAKRGDGVTEEVDLKSVTDPAWRAAHPGVNLQEIQQAVQAANRSNWLSTNMSDPGREGFIKANHLSLGGTQNPWQAPPAVPGQPPGGPRQDPAAPPPDPNNPPQPQPPGTRPGDTTPPPGAPAPAPAPPVARPGAPVTTQPPTGQPPVTRSVGATDNYYNVGMYGDKQTAATAAMGTLTPPGAAPAPAPMPTPMPLMGGAGDQMYAGGSQTFNEKTGQYQPGMYAQPAVLPRTGTTSTPDQGGFVAAPYQPSTNQTGIPGVPDLGAYATQLARQYGSASPAQGGYTVQPYYPPAPAPVPPPMPLPTGAPAGGGSTLTTGGTATTAAPAPTSPGQALPGQDTKAGAAPPTTGVGNQSGATTGTTGTAPTTGIGDLSGGAKATTSPTTGTGSSWAGSGGASATGTVDTSPTTGRPGGETAPATDPYGGISVEEAQQQADQAQIARTLHLLHLYSNITAGDNGTYYGTDFYGNRSLVDKQKLLDTGSSTAGEMYQQQLFYGDLMRKYGQQARAGMSRYLEGYNPNQFQSNVAGA